MAMGARVAMMWRRLLVLLIGGVIAVPYFAVVIWVVTASNGVEDRTNALAIIVTGVLAFLALCIPAFLSVIRALERTLAEQLLELNIPHPPRLPVLADRMRGAVFYFGHIFAGALLLFTIVVLVPSAIVLTSDPDQAHELSNGLIGTMGSAAVTELPAGLVRFLAIGVLLVCVAITIAEGYFLPHYALILLGPSLADRIELVGRERLRRFQRTVLAREVHDSIGHALTVTTMQAAVAKRTLHTDPDLAEAAVDEIARTGREAVAELDHVLSLLRSEAEPGEVESGEGGPVEDATEPPRRTMRDIELLVEEARSVGHPARLEITGDVGRLSPAIVHELHRIVREAVTNSLRHASEPGLSVSIEVDATTVAVEARNSRKSTGTGRSTTRERPGRGLKSISERVELFGGRVHWGAEGEEWRLKAVLPTNEGNNS